MIIASQQVICFRNTAAAGCHKSFAQVINNRDALRPHNLSVCELDAAGGSALLTFGTASMRVSGVSLSGHYAEIVFPG